MLVSMSKDSDAIRSRKTNASTSIDRVKKKIANESSSRSRTRKGRKSRRRQDEERSQTVACLVMAAFTAIVIILFVSGGRSTEGSYDTRKFQRAKALRDAVVNKGESFVGRISGGRKTMKTQKRRADSGKPGLSEDLNNGMRYLDPRQLPPLPGEERERYNGKGRKHGYEGDGDDAWEHEPKKSERRNHGPKVDYTAYKYEYPEILYEPPDDGTYPKLEPMENVFKTWGQDDLDSPPDTLEEVLMHFDYQDPEQVEAAIKYRDLELPFKVYNVPEVVAAGVKWTDEYVADHFNGDNDDDTPQSKGACQQSVDNFFAFHRAEKWDVDELGPPPSVDLEWTFDHWARHAVYADEVGLAVNQKHFYWQSGIPRDERLMKHKHWTFVSRDLPSFSSPDRTFFGFHPSQQKGIQCRFGERGVTAATHYDGGRNMIAMITGAKRYVLSPPIACPQLGMITSRNHPSYRHSMLNFGRVTLLDQQDTGLKMSKRERKWLRIAAEAPTLSTVLKAGEVLYVPSHWFHYIVSLQKSAQCNTRSGVNEEGSEWFGGEEDVQECVSEED